MASIIAQRGKIILALLAAAAILCVCSASTAGPAPGSAANTVLCLTTAKNSHALGSYAQIMPDPGGRLGISMVSSPGLARRFKPMAGDTLNLGSTTSALWLRFTLAAGKPVPGEIKETWLLTLNQPVLLKAELYAAKTAGEGQGTEVRWNMLATRSRTLEILPNPTRFTVFRLPPATVQPQTYYLKLTARAALLAAPEVWTQSAYLKKSRMDMLMLGAYSGIILALALYNLFLFFYIKDQSYLWYVLTIGAMAVYFLGFSGLLQDYLNVVPPVVTQNLPVYCLGLAYLFRGLFARSFLMTRAVSPKLDKLLLIFSVMMALLACLLPLPQLAPWPARVISTMGMVWPLLLFFLGGLSLRSGYKPAGFFLLAYVFAGVTSFFFAWTLRGWIPFVLWNLQAQQIGYISEAILLSIALGYRISTLREAKTGAEQALHVSEERYRKLLEASPDPMAVYDRQRRVLYVNPAFTRAFGWDVDDLNGCDNPFMPVELSDGERRALQGVWSGREISGRETRRLIKSGQSKEVSISASLLRGGQAHADGAVMTFRDISERKQAEQALLTQQTQLRNLTMDMTTSEERQRRVIAEDLHDSVTQNLATGLLRLRLAREGSSDAEHAAELDGVCQVLNQALLETRSLTFEISPPVLYDYGLAAGLEWLAESIQERHGLQINFMEKGKPPQMSENLSVTLFRASRELLINAVKHAEASQVELSVSTEAGQAMVIVADNGIGFNPDLELRSSFKGFGLFSIRERLELLGGGMDIESPPDPEGPGVRITLRAPLKHADA